MNFRFKRLGIAFIFAALFVLAHFLIWSLFNQAYLLIEAPKVVNGFAYAGYQKGQSPLQRVFPSTAELANDLSLLKPLTNKVRIYDSLENTEVIPLAARLDMKVTAGAWLDRDLDANRRQINALKQQIKFYPNIERAIVGNEVLLRTDLSVPQLIAYLDEVRKETKLPVSTAEPWHVWLKHPELVKHVSFIAVHLLPYHEGIPIEQALDYAMYRYQELLTAYPRKKIVISEIGWPSNGPTINAAVASQVNQAKFVREFLALSTKQNFDYYLIEAFDQPWKTAIEGWGGPYWGMFDANRVQKYSLQGAVPEDTRWIIKAIWSSLIAFIPILFMAYRFNHWKLGGRLSLALLIQVSITTLVVAWNLPNEYYYSLTDFMVLIGLLVGMLMTSAVLMIYGVEFSEVMFKGKWRRNYTRLPALPKDQELFVSVHLACYNEPPEMVIATIDSLFKLDYTNFEVIVVDNNTKDEAKWKPVEAYMAKLPSHFKFFHLPSWPGFKAGALNFALTQTNPKADVVGVVDADYEVTTDWLADLVPHFMDDHVAVVQAPQAHRQWENNFFRRMCNWEFEGFFKIGMHHRHERNALIQHGTMTLVRRDALVKSGAWSEWCICEDTELGLRLLENGYELRYIDDTFGRGLTPSNFTAFKSQRFRWAFGAMQILKHHLPKLLGDSNLNFGQRYHFITGWFGWLGDALQLMFTLGSIAWTLAMLLFPRSFSLPVSIMIITIICFLFIKAALGPILYRKTMNCRWIDILGASIASLGLSHAIAKGIISGLIKKDGVFKVTAKGKASASRTRFEWIQPIKEEALLLGALFACALAMLINRGFANIDAQIWVALLSLQALPYLSAVACQIIYLKQRNKD
ncbi:MAG: benzoate transporter [Methylotenera sp. 24-45-7]|jgi:exo-beta-1,3-glucanase (GH17 family)/cellulose synthase/poly-beta-1,6-N-acetylglucosamine synthase-like glycosyltransferase|nr:MAG: benzoate transporter [Methylotenera sp. 24-45-7]HQS44376.1 glycosyltransferase [Methylotenera sp.]